MDRTLISVAIACSIAGATAISIVAIPLAWHPREAPTQLAVFNWPEEALIEPAAAPKANMLVVVASNDIPLPPPEASHKIAVEKYTLLTEKEKSPAPPPKVEHDPKRDYCYPGHRVERRHGWRCVYARHHRR